MVLLGAKIMIRKDIESPLQSEKKVLGGQGREGNRSIMGLDKRGEGVLRWLQRDAGVVGSKKRGWRLGKGKKSHLSP